MRRTIFTLADKFEQKLHKTANYPSKETIEPIIQNVVNSLKGQNQLLKSVTQVTNVDVQNTIDAMLIYFQLMVKSNQYEQLINEPYKTELTGAVKQPVENALKAAYPAFDFRVKVGIVS